MKVLIDANVLVSAALKDRLPEEVMLFVVSHADMQWLVSPEILAEYREALGRSLQQHHGSGWGIERRGERAVAGKQPGAASPDGRTATQTIRPGLDGPESTLAKLLDPILAPGQR